MDEITSVPKKKQSREKSISGEQAEPFELETTEAVLSPEADPSVELSTMLSDPVFMREFEDEEEEPPDPEILFPDVPRKAADVPVTTDTPAAPEDTEKEPGGPPAPAIDKKESDSRSLQKGRQQADAGSSACEPGETPSATEGAESAGASKTAQRDVSPKSVSGTVSEKNENETVEPDIFFPDTPRGKRTPPAAAEKPSHTNTSNAGSMERQVPPHGTTDKGPAEEVDGRSASGPEKRKRKSVKSVKRGGKTDAGSSRKTPASRQTKKASADVPQGREDVPPPDVDTFFFGRSAGSGPEQKPSRQRLPIAREKTEGKIPEGTPEKKLPAFGPKKSALSGVGSPPPRHKNIPSPETGNTTLVTGEKKGTADPVADTHSSDTSASSQLRMAAPVHQGKMKEHPPSGSAERKSDTPSGKPLIPVVPERESQEGHKKPERPSQKGERAPAGNDDKGDIAKKQSSPDQKGSKIDRGRLPEEQTEKEKTASVTSSVPGAAFGDAGAVEIEVVLPFVMPGASSAPATGTGESVVRVDTVQEMADRSLDAATPPHDPGAPVPEETGDSGTDPLPFQEPLTKEKNTEDPRLRKKVEPDEAYLPVILPVKPYETETREMKRFLDTDTSTEKQDPIPVGNGSGGGHENGRRKRSEQKGDMQPGVQGKSPVSGAVSPEGSTSLEGSLRFSRAGGGTPGATRLSEFTEPDEIRPPVVEPHEAGTWEMKRFLDMDVSLQEPDQVGGKDNAGRKPESGRRKLPEKQRYERQEPQRPGVSSVEPYELETREVKRFTNSNVSPLQRESVPAIKSPGSGPENGRQQSSGKKEEEKTAQRKKSPVSKKTFLAYASSSVIIGDVSRAKTVQTTDETSVPSRTGTEASSPSDVHITETAPMDADRTSVKPPQPDGTDTGKIGRLSGDHAPPEKRDVSPPRTAEAAAQPEYGQGQEREKQGTGTVSPFSGGAFSSPGRSLFSFEKKAAAGAEPSEYPMKNGAQPSGVSPVAGGREKAGHRLYPDRLSVDHPEAFMSGPDDDEGITGSFHTGGTSGRVRPAPFFAAEDTTSGKGTKKKQRGIPGTPRPDNSVEKVLDELISREPFLSEDELFFLLKDRKINGFHLTRRSLRRVLVKEGLENGYKRYRAYLNG